MRRPPAAGRVAKTASDRDYPAFLGCGWAFPPTFVHPSAQVAMAAGETDIRQSLWILLSTGLGERLMLASYGCDLWSEVFTALTPTTASAIANMVANAIVEWEPRVIVEDVAVSASVDGSGWLNIIIEYRVIQTNSRSNLVFPYYTREATLLAPVG